MNADFQYGGNELELFASARKWKAYWASRLRPYVLGDVLDVGAGLGATARLLAADQRSWIALEPDAALVAIIQKQSDKGELPAIVTAQRGDLLDLPQSNRYDTILYIDVLEHIEHDTDELERAASHLRQDGRLIVLSPAHDWLFSPFDKALGHFRRYDKNSLAEAAPASLSIEKLFYLDSVGMLANLANRSILQSSQPTRTQIQFWDSYMVPISRYFVDPLTNFRLGKTIIGIWKNLSA